MSDSSDEEFLGFEADEIQQAVQRYEQILQDQGIGDDFEFNTSGNESEGSETEPTIPIYNVNDQVVPDIDNVANTWHNNFDIHERGLPHLFAPRGPDGRATGPATILAADKGPIDFFKLFLNDIIFEHIINETERYANQQIAENPDSNKSAWSKPSLPEIKAFIGLCFLMGIDVKPETKLYWSTDPFMESPIFRKTMPRNRFMQVMRYLHFSDNHNAQQPGHPSYDVLYKIRNILNMFNTSMKREFVPTRQVSIDECMIPFKGRVKFKQYMPAKPTKWGIKIWALADSNTGYICYTDVYTGKTDRPQGQLGEHVVKKCIEGADIVGQGYHVYVDNFFSSPKLFQDLFDNYQIAACGTVRKNRSGLPADFMLKHPVGIDNRGDMKFFQRKSISGVLWKDKKIVTAISTIHDHSRFEVQRLVQIDGQFDKADIPCPKIIVDYTKYMGGVDKADQYIQYYCFNQKTQKWYKRVFFKFLEILKYNAYRLFLLSPNHQTVGNSPAMTYLQFSRQIASSLIDEYCGIGTRGRQSAAPVPSRLIERHMPNIVGKKSWCHVCWMKVSAGKQDKRKQTMYGCLECGKHLCLPECFTAYHTMAKYC